MKCMMCLGSFFVCLFFPANCACVFDIRVPGLVRSERLAALCQVELTSFQAIAGCQGLCLEEV